MTDEIMTASEIVRRNEEPIETKHPGLALATERYNDTLLSPITEMIERCLMEKS